MVGLAGRPLVHYPLEALTEVLGDVVVACRRDTELPPLPGITQAWVEADGPRSAVHGIVCALREAGNRAIVVVGLPFALVTPQHVRALATAEACGRPAVMLVGPKGPEPLLARYGPTAIELLEALPPGCPPQQVVDALRPTRIEVAPGDPVLERVDAPEDLLRAQVVLDSRRRLRATA